MNVFLPKPPGAPKFVLSLISQITEIFRKVRPASGWKDKEAPLTAAKVTGANAPSWSAFQGNLYAYEFSASTDNEVFLTFHMPHDMAMSYRDYDGAMTDAKLYLHVHYASAAATPSTGDIRFGFEWSYADGYGTQAFTSPITAIVLHTPEGVQYQHEIAEMDESTAITGDFKTDGLLMVRFFRDADHSSDTNTDAIHIFTVDLHYWSDGLNTNERNQNLTAGQLPWTKQNPL